VLTIRDVNESHKLTDLLNSDAKLSAGINGVFVPYLEYIGWHLPWFIVDNTMLVGQPVEVRHGSKT